MLRDLQPAFNGNEQAAELTHVKYACQAFAWSCSARPLRCLDHMLLLAALSLRFHN